MNLFKKAIVASAVVASFGASAVNVSSDPALLSAQGVAAGNAAAGVDITGAAPSFDIDFVTGVLTPASSVITLTFDENVDLSLLAAAETATAVSNNVGAGTGATSSGLIEFDYGTGSFTFDKFNVDTSGDEHTITFEVNLGNPLVANSAFRMTINAAAVEVMGAAEVTYASADSDDNALEMGTATIATEKTQFTAAVKSDFDGVIERVAQDTFVSGYTGTDVDTDTAVFTLTNDETLLAPYSVTDVAIAIDGNFDNGSTTASLAATDFAVSGQAAGAGAYAFDAGMEELTIDTFTILATGADDDITVDFDGATKVIPVTGEMSATVTFIDGTDTADVEVAGVGEWMLDATVINVPYFPVGYEGTSTSVHFANESAAVADVIVSAIDDEGNTYGPMDLGMDLDGDTVTKVGQAAIMSLFELTDSTKLSVTFNIDADDGDVNAYAFTSSEVGRTEISNSQLKGK